LGSNGLATSVVIAPTSASGASIVAQVTPNWSFDTSIQRPTLK